MREPVTTIAPSLPALVAWRRRRGGHGIANAIIIGIGALGLEPILGILSERRRSHRKRGESGAREKSNPAHAAIVKVLRM